MLITTTARTSSVLKHIIGALRDPNICPRVSGWHFMNLRPLHLHHFFMVELSWRASVTELLARDLELVFIAWVQRRVVVVRLGLSAPSEVHDCNCCDDNAKCYAPDDSTSNSSDVDAAIVRWIDI